MSSSASSAPHAADAPVLVLGLGNLLLRDDGVGLELLRRLEAARGDDPRLQFVDGGTQGMALCGYLTGRRAVLLLDAVALGGAPGSVHRIDDPMTAAPKRSDSAHGANAGDLLAAAALLGELPDHVTMVGVEAATVRTGIGLSDAVERALPTALDCAGAALDALLATATPEPSEAPPCTR